MVAIKALESTLETWIARRARRWRTGARGGDGLAVQKGTLLLIASIGTLVSVLVWLDGRFHETGIFSLICVATVWTAYGADFACSRTSDPAKKQFLGTVLRTCSIGFAASTGLLAASTLLLPASVETRIMAGGFAVVYASGIAARHAEKPLLSIGKLALVLVPILTASLLSGRTGLIMVAIVLLPMVVVFALVTLTAFSALAQRLAEVEEAARDAQQLRETALRDTVTGLSNRAGLDATAKCMVESIGDDRKLVFFWIDLHRFREVNETLGHEVGDRMLQEMAKRLSTAATGAGVRARFASDEFVLLSEVGTRAEADALAGKLSLELSRPLRISGHRIESGAAIGAALWPDDASGMAELQEKADLALYHARIGGRHRVCFFDTGMTRDKVRRKDIEADLRTAMQRDELTVYFQPIVELATGRIRAFEALVRWFHPERGEIAPTEFIPVAEDSGMIITLGNWVAARAASACAAWPVDVGLALNLSPLQIRAPGAALGIMQALRDAGMDPRRLQIEVTESLFGEKDGNVALFMQELAAEGVTFVLDDFGTGQSSLGYIGQYPFHAIKVDESIVSGPSLGRSQDAIVRAVAELGQTLGMEIVAEGLETVDQVRAMRSAGCTLGQGFYYSHPVPDHMAANLLVEDERVVRIDRAG